MRDCCRLYTDTKHAQATASLRRRRNVAHGHMVCLFFFLRNRCAGTAAPLLKTTGTIAKSKPGWYQPTREDVDRITNVLADIEGLRHAKCAFAYYASVVCRCRDVGALLLLQRASLRMRTSLAGTLLGTYIRASRSPSA